MRALPAVLALMSSSAFALDATQLIDKHVAALGGREKLAALKTLKLTGSITYGGGDYAFKMASVTILEQPDKVRDEVSVQGLTGVTAWDGKEAWSIRPFGGRKDPERMAAEEAKNVAREAELAGPLVDAKARGDVVEALGTEDVDGTPAYQLKVSRKNGDYQLVFLDPDSFLIIRVETHAFQRGAENIDVTDFGNYEQVAGVWVPFSAEGGGKNAPKTSFYVVDKAEAGVTVDPALFAFPLKGVTPKPTGPATVTVTPGSSPAPAPTATTAARFDSAVVSGLAARNIGSAAMSGRIAAVAAYKDHGKTILFVGSASGGVWKSIDSGTTFKPVFDKQPVQSIGAIAVDPSNHDVVWVGTGESWTRNSVSAGDGVYKSTDGGETWTHVGLGASERVSKLLVHPKNGNVVYACVPGRLWADSPDRGLYRTSDGGKTWQLVLKGANLSTGCSGLSMDPKDPNVLVAGTWDFRRKGWTFRSGGEGPTAKSGSALFKSTDGGNSWVELTADTNQGLPPKPWGRIELAHAPSNGQVLYAFIEGVDSALFVSSDGGKTWDKRDKSQAMVWRPFYFARLSVDPHDPQHLFKADGALIVSNDGGKSFSYSGGGGHGDWHDVWFDPDNSMHLIGGDDGGLWISHDGGNRWWKVDALPVSQFYHVQVDDADPYRVYGGLQDNGSWSAESAWPGGIGNDRWDVVGGGDGFHTFADPADPAAVYSEMQGGELGRLDRRTRAFRPIQPTPRYKEKLRFNWNTPLHASPTQKGTIYLGAQFLFRSKDQGQSWERISPDLTTNDPEKQKQEESGGITVDNSSAEMHTSLSTISESPKDARVIWVGTDDGNVQLTRDGAKTWVNLTPNLVGLPANSWVSSIEASRFAPGTAYATFDRHTFGDFDPYVYRTTDFGKTWARLAGPGQGLTGWAHCVKEDTVKPGLLFVGTELGLFVSIDGGARWARYEAAGYPKAVAVRELQVQPREGDLVIATHGRGIWIIDDLSPLRALSDEVLSKAATFLPSRPSQQRLGGLGGWVTGDAKFVGENPRGGAGIAYYQSSRHVFGPLTLEVLGPDKKVIDTIPAGKGRGINRVTWSMQTPPPKVPRAAQLAGSAASGPRVLPGTYTLRLKVGTQTLEQPLVVTLDRRAPYSVADRKAQFDAMMRVHALFGAMSKTVDLLDAAIATAEADQAKLPAGDPLAQPLGALVDKLATLKKDVVATKEGGAITGEERLREHADRLYGTLGAWEGRPGSYQLEYIEVLTKELAEVDRKVAAVLTAEVPPLEAPLKDKHLAPIPTTLGLADPVNVPGGAAVQRAVDRWRLR